MRNGKRIRKRQQEGIDAALQNGVSFRRPKAERNEEFIEIYNRWKSGEMTAVGSIKEIGVKKTTFYKLVKEHEKVFKKVTIY